jgi:hypothetical protein
MLKLLIDEFTIEELWYLARKIMIVVWLFWNIEGVIPILLHRFGFV